MEWLHFLHHVGVCGQWSLCGLVYLCACVLSTTPPEAVSRTQLAIWNSIMETHSGTDGQTVLRPYSQWSTSSCPTAVINQTNILTKWTCTDSDFSQEPPTILTKSKIYYLDADVTSQMSLLRLAGRWEPKRWSWYVLLNTPCSDEHWAPVQHKVSMWSRGVIVRL